MNKTRGILLSTVLGAGEGGGSEVFWRETRTDQKSTWERTQLHNDIISHARTYSRLVEERDKESDRMYERTTSHSALMAAQEYSKWAVGAVAGLGVGYASWLGTVSALNLSEILDKPQILLSINEQNLIAVVAVACTVIGAAAAYLGYRITEGAGGLFDTIDNSFEKRFKERVSEKVAALEQTIQVAKPKWGRLLGKMDYLSAGRTSKHVKGILETVEKGGSVSDSRLNSLLEEFALELKLPSKMVFQKDLDI